jgi:predicted permease
MLGLGGAILGLAVAKWGGALLVNQLGGAVTLDLSIDWRVLAFTGSVALLTSVIFGLAPAVGVSRVSPHEALKIDSRGVIGDRRFGLRSVLVVGQIALSLSLIVGAALFLRTLSALVTAPLGFVPEPLLVATVTAPASIPEDQRAAFYDRLSAAASAVPGVASATVSMLTPIGTTAWNTRLEKSPDLPHPPAQTSPWVNSVQPGWFKTMGTPILQGRDFDSRDVKGAPRVMIVSESFVREFFPGSTALGRRISGGLEGPKIYTFEIVGIVSDTVYRSRRAGFQPILYVPVAQLDEVWNGATLVVQAASGQPEGLTRGLAQSISSVDPAASFTIRSYTSQLRSTLQQERLVAILGGFFGGLALLLASLGLYGVTSYSVNRRRGEIGIRMALGADRGGVLRLVMQRVSWLLVAGVVFGAGLTWWASRFVSTLLFGLEPRDPLTFSMAAAVLALAGMLAGWLPARRAARIDPARVLREG